MMKILVFVALVAFAAAEKASYDNYKVFRIVPKTKEQLSLLRDLENVQGGYQFWNGPSVVNRPVDLMVAPSQLSEMTELLKSNRLAYNVYINDVQRLINAENPVKNRKGSEDFDLESYHDLDEIHAYLDSLAEKYPEIVEVINAGKSYEGRTLKGVKLSFGSEKPGVFIEGGIHAREWISPATALYIVNAFLTSEDPAIRQLAESFDWYVVPSVNPDGYVYTHKSDRLWRKTRSVSKNSNCKGADPNRNWDYLWNKIGSSDNPCSETYAGSKAFSEIEMKTLADYIKTIKDKVFTFISFHSYSQLLLFPYGHTAEHLENYDDHHAIAEKGVKALAKRYGTRYVIGNPAEAIYETSGISMDYAKGALKIPLSFTYELRDTGRHGFVLPADQIAPNSEEILDSLIAMFEEAKKLGYPGKSGN